MLFRIEVIVADQCEDKIAERISKIMDKAAQKIVNIGNINIKVEGKFINRGNGYTHNTSYHQQQKGE